MAKGLVVVCLGVFGAKGAAGDGFGACIANRELIVYPEICAAASGTGGGTTSAYCCATNTVRVNVAAGIA